MQWKRAIIAAAVVCAVLAGCGKPKRTAGTSTTEGGVDLGQTAPNIAGVDLDGHAFQLSDYRGKVVMLDFWKTL